MSDRSTYPHVVTLTTDKDTSPPFSFGSHGGGGIVVPDGVSALTFWVRVRAGIGSAIDEAVYPALADGTTTQITRSIPAGGAYIQLPYELHGAQEIVITADVGAEVVIYAKS